MYWTKNGSIPSQETDGTEGWKQAPSPPAEIPAGKELVWLNWEWIIRDPKPQDRDGYQWNWQHDTRSWVEGKWGNVEVVAFEDQAEQPIQSFTSDQFSNLTTAQL
jgi:hypothetical protein